LRSHEERQGGAIVPEGAEAAGSRSPEGDKGVALGFGLQEAFGSRRCGVKQPQGGSRSLKPKQAPAQVGRPTQQDFYQKKACGVTIINKILKILVIL